MATPAEQAMLAPMTAEQQARASYIPAPVMGPPQQRVMTLGVGAPGDPTGPIPQPPAQRDPRLVDPNADAARVAGAIADQSGFLGRLGANVAQGFGEGLNVLERGWRDVGVLAKKALTEPQNVPLDQYVFGKITDPEDATTLQSAVGLDPEKMTSYGQIAQHAGAVTKFFGGLAALPPSLLEPKSLVAMWLSKNPTALATGNPATRAFLAGVEQKLGVRAAQAVEAELHAAANVGTFSAAQTAIEGGSTEDVIKAGAKGSLEGLAFGLPGVAKAGKGAIGDVVAGRSAAKGEAFARDAQQAFRPDPTRPNVVAESARTPEVRPDAPPPESITPEALKFSPEQIRAAQEAANRPPVERAQPAPQVPEPVAQAKDQPTSDAFAPKPQEAPPVEGTKPPAPAEMTREQLMGELDAAGVKYGPKVKDEVLRAKVEQLRAQEPVDVKPPAPAEPSAAAKPEADAGLVRPGGQRVAEPARVGPGREAQSGEVGRSAAAPELPNPVDRADGRTGAGPAVETARAKTPESFLDRVEREARERIQRRQLPRSADPARPTGGTTLGGDLRDTAIIAAARVAKAGVRTAKAIRETVETVAKELGIKLDDSLPVAREAFRIVREAGEGGKDIEKAIAASLERHADRPEGTKKPTIKQSIAQTTGMKDAADLPTVSERDALKANMRAQARAARQSRNLAIEEMTAKLDDFRQEVRTKATDALEIRRQAADLVKKYAPPELAGKYLKAIANAGKEGTVANLADRIVSDVAEYRLKTARRQMKKALNRADERKMLDQYRTVVESAKGQAKVAERKLAELLPRVAEAEAKAAKIADLERRNRTLEKLHAVKLEQLNQTRRALLEVQQKAQEAKHAQKVFEEVQVAGKVKARTEVLQETLDNLAKVDQSPGMKAARAVFGLGDGEIKGGKFTKPQTSLRFNAAVAHMNRDTIARFMGDGSLRRMLVEDVWAAENKYQHDLYLGAEARRQAVETTGLEFGSPEARKLSATTAGDKADSVMIKAGGKNIEMTPAEVGGLIARITDLEARGKLLDAGFVLDRLPNNEPIRISRDEIKPLERSTDPTIDRMRRIVAALKDDLAERVTPAEAASFREHFGYDMELHPGHWHQRRKIDRSGTPGMIDGSAHAPAPTLSSMGAWKLRDPAANKSPYLIGDVFAEHADMIREAAARTHLNQPTRNLQVLLRDGALQDAVTKRYGPDFWKAINDTARQSAIILEPPQVESKIKRGVEYMKRNYSRAVLSANPSPILKNLGGIAKIPAYIEPKYVALAMKDMASPAVYKRMIEGSPFLRARHEQSAAIRASHALGEVSDVLGKPSLPQLMREAKSRPWKTLGELADRLPFFSWADSRASVVAWRANELKVEALHPDWTPAQKTKWVAEQTEPVIRRTQNPGSIIDMSRTAAKHRGDMLSLGMMFQSDNIVNLNMLIQGAMEGKKEFAKKAAGVAANDAWAASVTTMLRAGLPALVAIAAGKGAEYALQKHSDDAKDTFVKEALKNGLGKFYGANQLADIADAIWTALADNKPSSRLDTLTDPITSTITGGVRALVGAADTGAKLLEDQNEKQQAKTIDSMLRNLERLGLAGSNLAGMPIAPVYALGKRLVRAGTEGPDQAKVVRLASAALRGGNTEGAAKAIRTAAQAAKDSDERDKLLKAIRERMRDHGPRGAMSAKDWEAHLASKSPEARRALEAAQDEWLDKVSALVDRVEASIVGASPATNPPPSKP
jgi:hypothetical protein